MFCINCNPTQTPGRAVLKERGRDGIARHYVCPDCGTQFTEPDAVSHPGRIEVLLGEQSASEGPPPAGERHYPPSTRDPNE